MNKPISVVDQDKIFEGWSIISSFLFLLNNNVVYIILIKINLNEYLKYYFLWYLLGFIRE